MIGEIFKKQLKSFHLNKTSSHLADMRMGIIIKPTVTGKGRKFLLL